MLRLNFIILFLFYFFAVSDTLLLTCLLIWIFAVRFVVARPATMEDSKPFEELMNNPDRKYWHNPCGADIFNVTKTENLEEIRKNVLTLINACAEGLRDATFLIPEYVSLFFFF